MATNEQVLAARKLIDAYRSAHGTLSASVAHSQLEEQMLFELKKIGFSSLAEFYDANSKLNKTTNTDKTVSADIQNIMGNWT